jgi:hypothetical protein
MIMEIPPISAEEMEAYTREFEADGLKAKAEMETLWRSTGQAFAWIDPVPTYMEEGDWSNLYWHEGDAPPYTVHYHFPCPAIPARRILRLALLGGGQIRSSEQFQRHDDDDLARWREPTWRTAGAGRRPDRHCQRARLRRLPL